MSLYDVDDFQEVESEKKRSSIGGKKRLRFETNSTWPARHCIPIPQKKLGASSSAANSYLNANQMTRQKSL